MTRRPPRYTLSSSSAASDVYKRQEQIHQANPFNRAIIKDSLLKIAPLCQLIPRSINSIFISDPMTQKQRAIVPQKLTDTFITTNDSKTKNKQNNAIFLYCYFKISIKVEQNPQTPAPIKHSHPCTLR
eukprot:TRINITY_DN13490_c0_g1_i2.p2 TRINITY_DN13490_c0_g1~~TRINITY_DN13490_c0_g1_i2.p2  ORF type:complete len:128 (+),score=15.15 TRINITY_DN13490_c0_g1_i2:70-453(+)